MPLEDWQPAIVLRKVDVGESDRVVVLYTRGQGKVATIARGARNSKKRFAGSLEAFQLLKVSIQQRKHSDLGMLTAADVEKSFPRISKDIDAIHSGWRLLELLDLFEQDHHANPELFDQLMTLMESMDLGLLTAAQWRMSFEALILNHAGLTPHLDSCLGCHKEPLEEETWLSEAEGGFLCSSCRQGRPAVFLEKGEIDSLRCLFGGEDCADPRMLLRLEELIRYHLGKVPKTSRYMDQIQ